MGTTNIDNIGIEGIEKTLNDRLTNSTKDLRLTIDLGVQYTVREELIKAKEEFKAERKSDAEKNIKTRLVLQRIISENKITASQEELDAQIEDYASKYQMSAEDFKKGIGPNDYAFFENNIIITSCITWISFTLLLTFSTY